MLIKLQNYPMFLILYGRKKISYTYPFPVFLSQFRKIIACTALTG